MLKAQKKRPIWLEFIQEGGSCLTKGFENLIHFNLPFNLPFQFAFPKKQKI